MFTINNLFKERKMIRLQNVDLVKDRQESDMVQHITDVLLHGGANDADIQEMLDAASIDMKRTPRGFSFTLNFEWVK
tara:strand:- start:7695 stop:7925 length:231 start_codon:yes stop_codon:yes gene_type:complete